MDNELQNEEFILPGNLGAVKIGNEVHPIKSVEKRKDGTNIITISPEWSDSPIKKINTPGFIYEETKIKIENGK